MAMSLIDKLRALLDEPDESADLGAVEEADETNGTPTGDTEPEGIETDIEPGDAAPEGDEGAAPEDGGVPADDTATPGAEQAVDNADDLRETIRVQAAELETLRNLVEQMGWEVNGTGSVTEPVTEYDAEQTAAGEILGESEPAAVATISDNPDDMSDDPEIDQNAVAEFDEDYAKREAELAAIKRGN